MIRIGYIKPARDSMPSTSISAGRDPYPQPDRQRIGDPLLAPHWVLGGHSTNQRPQFCWIMDTFDGAPAPAQNRGSAALIAAESKFFWLEPGAALSRRMYPPWRRVIMKFVMKRTLLALLSLAGFVWAAPVTAQVDTLKIGIVSALSGPGSEWGLAQDGAAKIAAMEVNAKGGLKVGNKTYKIEVISYDDQYKAALAVTAATRLIEQDKVKIIVGPMGSASTLAVKPLFEKNKILAIIGAYSEKALDAETKYSFRGFPTTIEYGTQIVAWLKKNRPGLKTVAELDRKSTR